MLRLSSSGRGAATARETLPVCVHGIHCREGAPAVSCRAVEQTRSPVSDVTFDEVPSLAPVAPEPPPLARWAEAARAGEAGAVTLLTAVLAALVPTQPNADALLALLESDALEALDADDGRPLKEHAVEALLRLGFPHALRVHPDHLAQVRSLQRARVRRKWLLAITGVLAAASTLGLGSWLLFN